MITPRPFCPQGPNKSVKASITTSNSQTAIPGSPNSVRLRTDSTDSLCYIDFGISSSVASTTTSIAFAPGSVESFSVPLNATHICAITATGTATLYITPGEGW